MSSEHGRAHARYGCDFVVEILDGGRRRRPLGLGRVSDASVSGACLLFNGTLRRSTTYRLKLASGGAETIRFQVVREAIRDPRRPETRRYGLAFVFTDEERDSWRARLDLLRRNASTPREDRIERSLRSYWG